MIKLKFLLAVVLLAWLVHANECRGASAKKDLDNGVDNDEFSEFDTFEDDDVTLVNKKKQPSQPKSQPDATKRVQVIIHFNFIYSPKLAILHLASILIRYSTSSIN